MKINYVPDIQHIIRWSPVMIYKCVDSACPLFLVFRHLSARKMFVCYIKIIACAFPTRPHVIYVIYTPQQIKCVCKEKKFSRLWMISLNPQPRWFVDDTTPLDYLNIKRKNYQNNKKLEILLKQYNAKKLQV